MHRDYIYLEMYLCTSPSHKRSIKSSQTRRDIWIAGVKPRQTRVIYAVIGEHFHKFVEVLFLPNKPRKQQKPPRLRGFLLFSGMDALAEALDKPLPGPFSDNPPNLRLALQIQTKSHLPQGFSSYRVLNTRIFTRLS